jgi:prolipoprotein diacylglyceryltransferase
VRATTYFALWTAGGLAGCGAAILVLRARRALTATTFVAPGIALLALFVGANLQFRFEVLPVLDALEMRPGDLFAGAMRLPLGMLAGGALAACWCLATRAPWRETGDALAVGAFVMVPIGRLGCWLNGCCMGAACGRWALPFCVRFSPDTEAYRQQLEAHLIPPSATVSLPAHPLPLFSSADRTPRCRTSPR